MRISIITVTQEGDNIAETLKKTVGGDIDMAGRSDVARLFNERDAFIFIGAMGICVRTVAPLIGDKHTDPAVICVDSMGRNVISVLSGHVGGANRLAREVAAAIGARPVITTQSDNQGLWALDTIASDFGWSEVADNAMNNIITTFVNRQPTALWLETRDRGTDFLEETKPEHVTIVGSEEELSQGGFALCIIVSPFRRAVPEGMLCLRFVPRAVSVGIGLAHQAAPADDVISGIRSAVAAKGIMDEACRYATIDIKSDEPVVRRMIADGEDFTFFTASQLSEIDVPTPSETVAKHVGTPSVSEAAALLLADGGEMLIEKQKGSNFTVAAAIGRRWLRRGHIEIVGAGPGDPELVSVRGRRMLERADLILYAGSLVPRELTLCAKEGATVRSSADMNLDEQCSLMKSFYDRGAFIVRLHTGDPCIFGAIQEQMAFFDEHGMSYHITPGISSFLAAAAELRSQFTIPERCQTIILTRGEGRTPMPEREKLHLLARSQSTMCIFLSASIVDDVQAQLLEEYPEDTPIAACYHLTWKDQAIYRGKLKNLAEIVKSHDLTLTTMIVVGEAIDNRSNTSLLYDRNFSHLFRN
ncbi:MAG: precorrin-4 C(11)-methyltransferase [Prevotella sp.]|uniref:precorrin-4 C(11)-methyltransferase n=1 Tax=Prevotella sp. TaxID=59823 RepID=UPI002A2F19C4|nr:precorrin-4 C(11)-methyltransferase [Prevotella sp.]MDD7318966.1 precorrin-4 C(11)-methyltransferase [Prevotellaceae bacterium]MDY4019992.1 precorrin-4 C(11)-methyltransferase [Prevotella sp.]